MMCILKTKNLRTYIEICQVCNLTCTHCYNASTQTSNSPFMSFDLFTRIIDNITDSGISTFAISGGEPLLHPEITRMLEYVLFKEEVYSITLVTNGTLIKQKIPTELLSHANLNIQISMDGGSAYYDDLVRGKGHFDTVMSNIEYLQTINHNISIHMVITGVNYQSIEDLIGFCERNSIGFSFSMVNCLGRASYNWEELEIRYDTLKKIMSLFNVCKDKYHLDDHLIPKGTRYCPIVLKQPLENTLIKQNGTVYPCHVLYADSFCIGDLNKKDYNEIIDYNKNQTLHSISALFSIRNKLLFQNNKQCLGCLIRSVCGGGCPGIAFNNNGFFEPDGNCFLRKTEAIKVLMSENQL